MAKILDKMLIVDVESTCWETKPPPNQQNEIIEVGICLLDLAKGQIDDKYDLFVKPEFSEISNFCTTLTGITKDMVAEGQSFRDVCIFLQKNCKAQKRTWASWGDYDRKQFERQCVDSRYSAKFPFGPTHLNLKNLFAIKMKLTREVGMDQALQILGKELEGTHHRALDDAKNISQIAIHLLE